MTFAKGKSGNPSGRPKKLLPDGRSLSDLAKAHTDIALMALCDVLQDDAAPHAARVSAATALLDRGWGRPSQAVELTGKDGGVIQIEQKTSEDAHAFRSRLLSGTSTGSAASGIGKTVQ